MARRFEPLSFPLTPETLILEASAGTGKTYAMVQVAMRIMLGDTQVHSRGPRHLLLVTFTKAAAAELKDRLRHAIHTAATLRQGGHQIGPDQEWLGQLLDRLGTAGDSRIRALTRQIDELSVSTINSFCVGILRDFAAECGVRSELTFSEDDTLLLKQLRDDELRRIGWGEPWRAAVLAGIADGESSLEPTEDPTTKPTTASSEHLQANFARELQALRYCWNRETLQAQLEQACWLQDAPMLADARFRTAVLDQLDLLLGGDPSGVSVLGMLHRERLCQSLRKRSRQEKQAKAALLDHPILVALGRLAVTLERWQQALKWEVSTTLTRQLPFHKAILGVATFDDQISLVAEALRDSERGPLLARLIAGRYDAILIDEAQDTNREQWEILRSGFQGLPRLLVGDPKQSIYGWRGADLESYLEERDQAGSQRNWQLSYNWRSTAGLLQAIESLFTRAPDPFMVQERRMDFVPVQPGRTIPPLSDPDSAAPLRWLVLQGHQRAPVQLALIRRQVVAEIQRLISGSVSHAGVPLTSGDIAILVRSHHEAALYQTALRRVGINAVLSGSGEITDSPIWGEVASLLRALAAPDHPDRWRVAAATLLAGFSAGQLTAWLADPDHPDAQGWRRLLVEAHQVASQRGTGAALALLTSQRDSVLRLARASGGERLLTDYRHVLELLQQEEIESGLSPSRMAHWMERSVPEQQGSRDRHQLRLESDDKAVQIRTVHASKGLEYPVVFLPDSSRGSKGRKAESAQRKEEMRLFYVAVTRARLRCYLVLSSSSGQSDFGALGHLLRTPSESSSNWDAVSLAAKQLIADSAGKMDLLPQSATQLSSTTAPRRAIPALTAREYSRGKLSSWTITSYSSLASHAPAAVIPSAVDYDDPSNEDVEVDDGLSQPSLLPAGPRSGAALHALLERLDFAADDATIAAAVRDALTAQGIASGLSAIQQTAQVEETATLVARLLRTPVPDWGFALAEVPRERTLREWRILLRLERNAIQELAQQFQHLGVEFAGYSEAVTDLAPTTLEGFLTGTVDLVFEHGGEWYLVDWKSNRLGNHPSSYSRSAMHTAMLQHHYYLQRAIYRTALERFLALRAPGARIAGVGYAFLRGGTWLT